MTPIGVALAIVAGVLGGARTVAARLDELAHAPATEADRVFVWRGEMCTPRTCLVDGTSSCCVYMTHTLRPRHVPSAATAARGRFAVRVGVSPDGAVESAAVAPSSGDDAFDECVAAAIAAARFPRSAKGIRFRYPFAP